MHNITISKGQVEAAFSLVPAWHGLGVVTEERVSIADLFALAGLGWTVSTTDLLTSFGGNLLPVPGVKGIQRDDTGAVLGVASGKYQSFQNTELLDIASEVFGDAKLGETAFSLRGGEEVVLTLALGEDAVKAGKVEDAHRTFLLLGTGHDGKTPIYALGTNTRVVCENTLRIALGSRGRTLSREGISIRHSAQHGERVKALVAALKEIREGHAASMAQLRKLVKGKLGKDRRLDFFGKVVDTILPPPAQVEADPKLLDKILAGAEADRKIEKSLRERRRDDILDTILAFHDWEVNANGMPGDSAYTAFQAVSDTVEHVVVNARGDERARAENEYTSRMNGKGDAVKQEALSILETILGGAVSTLPA